jgi:hypothetical protein
VRRVSEKDEHRTSNVEHCPSEIEKKFYGVKMLNERQKNEIKLRSGATSLFDVQRWTFDVGR